MIFLTQPVHHEDNLKGFDEGIIGGIELLEESSEVSLVLVGSLGTQIVSFKKSKIPITTSLWDIPVYSNWRRASFLKFSPSYSLSRWMNMASAPPLITATGRSSNRLITSTKLSMYVLSSIYLMKLEKLGKYLSL